MKARLLVFFVALGVAPATSGAQTRSANDSSVRCTALASADFSGIPDAITQVMNAKSQDPIAETPAYCQIIGYVAPSVGFTLRLPTANWNGKFIEMGCGGWCGTTEHVVTCDAPLRRGYACIVSDGGHKGNDAKWAYNNLQARIDFAIRANHVTALAGKAIAEHYYGHAPRKSYFMGCSRGGEQALSEAQRFPWDFNGIIAGAPGIRGTELRVERLWDRRALTDSRGVAVIGPDELGILHRAVVEKCDLNDGIKDGLIGNPRACHFNPAELLCTPDKKSGCLTAQQIAAVTSVYGGAVTSLREHISMPSAMLGSELNWLDWFVGANSGEVYLGDGFRYDAFDPSPGPAWRLEHFDFDQDYKRLGVAESLDPVNPDLRRFKHAGGKLISYMGWSDVAAGGPMGIVDYYETAERVVGGRRSTQEFFRLFMVPGMNHCYGGSGAFAIDYLTYLEDWVERGKAPDKMIGVHIDLPSDTQAAYETFRKLKMPVDPAQIEFSRPIYPYPTIAKYSGHGDPNDALSFVPAVR